MSYLSDDARYNVEKISGEEVAACCYGMERILQIYGKTDAIDHYSHADRFYAWSDAWSYPRALKYGTLLDLQIKTVRFCSIYVTKRRKEK